uniref:Uncharacterized protein n=1 Tax=Oryza sativa subsp. japonica TaxID=39947 RepID=Q94I21_ORYSJ|nr:Hypothetical protein [Oryza sativa Japonica Group]
MGCHDPGGGDGQGSSHPIIPSPHLFPQQSVAVFSISFPPLQQLEPGQIQEEEEGKRKEGLTRIPGSDHLEGNVATASIIFLLFSSLLVLSSSLAPNSLLQDLRFARSGGQGVRKQQIQSHKL